MKKLFKKSLSLFLAIIIVLTSLIMTNFVWAAESSNETICIEVTTDKSTYRLMDTAKVTIKATNTGDKELKNVVLTADSTDLMFLNKNGNKYVSIDSLEKGKSLTWEFDVILSKKFDELNFFQKIIVFFKNLFTASSDFSRGYENSEQSAFYHSDQISFAGLSANINAYAFYDGSTKIINANSIETFSSAISNLIKQQTSNDSFDSSIAAKDDYYSGRIIIKGKNINFDDYEAETIIAGPDNTYIVQFDSSTEAKKFQVEQNSKFYIEYAEPDIYMQVDPIESSMSSATSEPFMSWGVKYIGADVYAKYISDNGLNKDITVAVVDTGVDLDNTYLSGRITNNGYDYVDDDNYPDDERYHGTHVAGTIVDCTPGLSVKIMPVRVLDENGEGYISAVASGIEYAADKGAQIINLSLGGGHSSYTDDAIEYAIEKGATVCVAAGNDNTNTQSVCPAHITTPGNITVAAIDSSGTKANFSNYGYAVDVTAPGVSIYSTFPNNKFESISGTSMATPHITAVAAMVKLANPSASPSQIENYIKTYTTDLGASGYDIYYGYGVPTLHKAIPNQTYTLTYNANGGSNTPASQSGNTTYTISSSLPTRFGYTFLGWSKSSSATSATYEPNDSISISSNTTLYAVWKSATAVSANSNISTAINFANQEVYYTFTPSSTGDYIFESSGSLDTKVYLYNSSGTEIGYDDDGSDYGYNFMLINSLTSGTKYYVMVRAHNFNVGSMSFTITKKAPTAYTLSYNANGGSNPPSSQSGGTSYTISSTTPTRTGYKFLGWSKSSSASYASYYAGDSITISANTTLYAVWGKSTVTLSNYSSSYTADIGQQTYRDQHFSLANGTGAFMYSLPSVTTQYCNSSSYDGWYVVSGSASVIGDYVHITQPGRIVLRYRKGDVYSSDYVINIKFYDTLGANHYLKSSPNQGSSDLDLIPKGTKVEISSFTWGGTYTSNGVVRDAVWAKTSYGGYSGYINGFHWA